MTTTVVTIVEGAGEVAAIPVLLRRVAASQTPNAQISIATPIRVRKDRFLRRSQEFERFLRLAASKCGKQGWILIVLDADDECPATRGNEIFSQARAHVADIPLSVVLANREYEAWFIAAARSLNGFRGFHLAPDEHLEAETPRDAKGWIGAHMSSKVYSETTDQPAFSARMDLQQAIRSSRSFRRLCDVWNSNISQE